jgi:hypothetical protein
MSLQGGVLSPKQSRGKFSRKSLEKRGIASACGSVQAKSKDFTCKLTNVRWARQYDCGEMRRERMPPSLRCEACGRELPHGADCDGMGSLFGFCKVRSVSFHLFSVMWVNYKPTELTMLTLLKWFLAAFAAVFLWLIGKYTAEYFDYTPHKKYPLRKRG